jgi:hypothetical protein
MLEQQVVRQHDNASVRDLRNGVHRALDVGLRFDPGRENLDSEPQFCSLGGLKK